MRRPSRLGMLPVCTPGTANFPCRHVAFPCHSFLFGKILPAFLLTALSIVSYGQHGVPFLQAYFSAVRTGAPAMLPKLTLLPGNESLYIDSLRPFLQDSMPHIRAKAYEIVGAVSAGVPGLPTRRRGVAILVSACRDPTVENAGLALELLTHFKKTDFSPAALDSFSNYLSAGSPYIDRVVKLAGFLGLHKLTEDIRPYAQPGNAVPIRWAALLAMARLGEPSAIADITRRVKKFPLNDNLVSDIFPDLIYTRRRELIAITVEVLEHDEKSCLSANPDKEVPIPCGYRIMEMLAPVIDGYPFHLAESGDIRTEDYPAALQQVRQFFSTNKEYEIRTDQY